MQSPWIWIFSHRLIQSNWPEPVRTTSHLKKVLCWQNCLVIHCCPGCFWQRTGGLLVSSWTPHRPVLWLQQRLEHWRSLLQVVPTGWLPVFWESSIHWETIVCDQHRLLKQHSSDPQALLESHLANELERISLPSVLIVATGSNWSFKSLELVISLA